ncbi:MAG: hypothetical protein AVDCRST_MAG30-3971, partial [uncultured Solirubrobacteraceae bacterium]
GRRPAGRRARGSSGRRPCPGGREADHPLRPRVRGPRGAAAPGWAGGLPRGALRRGVGRSAPARRPLGGRLRAQAPREARRRAARRAPDPHAFRLRLPHV